MLSGFYKMLFDISYYYAITTYFMYFVFRVPADIGGFLLIMTGIVITLFSSFFEKTKKHENIFLVIGMLLPVTRFFFIAPICLLQLVIIWAYAIITLVKRRYYVYYDICRDRFKKMFMILAVLLMPMLLNMNLGIKSLLYAVNFLIVYLTVGPLLLRTLRNEDEVYYQKDFHKMQIIELTIFFCFCVFVTLGGIPEILGKGILEFWNKVLYPFVSFCGWALFYIVYKVLYWIYLFMMLFKRKQTPCDIEKQKEESEAIMKAKEEIEQKFVKGYPTLIYVIIALIVLALLCWLLVWLFGEKKRSQKESAIIETREKIKDKPHKKVKAFKKHSRNPREVIRYYYREFLIRCTNMGIKIINSDNSNSIYEKYKDVDFDNEIQAAQISELYRNARYHMNAEVSMDDVKEAEKIWKEIKHKGDNK